MLFVCSLQAAWYRLISLTSLLALSTMGLTCMECTISPVLLTSPCCKRQRSMTRLVAKVYKCNYVTRWTIYTGMWTITLKVRDITYNNATWWTITLKIGGIICNNVTCRNITLKEGEIKCNYVTCRTITLKVTIHVHQITLHVELLTHKTVWEVGNTIYSFINPSSTNPTRWNANLKITSTVVYAYYVKSSRPARPTKPYTTYRRPVISTSITSKTESLKLGSIKILLRLEISF